MVLIKKFRGNRLRKNYIVGGRLKNRSGAFTFFGGLMGVILGFIVGNFWIWFLLGLAVGFIASLVLKLISGEKQENL